MLPINCQKDIIDRICDSWFSITGLSYAGIPSHEKFIFREVSGQGATSRQFILSVSCKDGKETNFFIKQYDPKKNNRGYWLQQLERDFEVSLLMTNLLTAKEILQVAEPYFILPHELIMVSQYIEGINLGKLFFKSLRLSRFQKKGVCELYKIVKRVGLGLRKIQDIPLSLLNEQLPVPSSAEARKEICTLFEEVVDFFERNNIWVELVRKSHSFFFEKTECYFEKNPFLCFEHHDFILQNIIIDQNKNLFIFDFPNAHIGTPYMDIAHFLNSLDDILYLKTVHPNSVMHLQHFFLSEVWSPKILDHNILKAYQLYIQLRSSQIVLSSREKGLPLWKRFFLKNPSTIFRLNINRLLAP